MRNDMQITTEFATFPARRDRTVFIAKRFNKYLRESVLDVGCFESPLKEIIAPVPYIGVDVVGRPDVLLDLEKCERLPFNNNSFHAVLCIDVLEHLDNFHAIFSELIRVSEKYIIISLPNCWCDARLKVDRGRGHFKHYGLPLERPEDRHKWFFSLTEARTFIEGKANDLNLRIETLFITEKPRFSIFRLLRKIRYPGERYRNRYSSTIWVVYDKSGSSTLHLNC